MKVIHGICGPDSQVTGTVKVDEFGSASDEDDYLFEFLADGGAADVKEQVCACVFCVCVSCVLCVNIFKRVCVCACVCAYVCVPVRVRVC